MIKNVRASDAIGARVRRLRLDLGLTREQVSDLCAEVGEDISAAVLVNIEGGRPDKITGRRRRDVTVDELLALAYALKTSPTSLLMPDRDERLLISPDVPATPYAVAEWFAGRRWPTGLPPVPYERNTAHIRLYHAAWEAWEAFKMADRAARWAEKSGDESAQTSHKTAAMESVHELARALDAMVEAGVEPPEVDPGTANMMINSGWISADRLRIMED